MWGWEVKMKTKYKFIELTIQFIVAVLTIIFQPPIPLLAIPFLIIITSIIINVNKIMIDIILNNGLIILCGSESISSHTISSFKITAEKLPDILLADINI